MLRILSEKKRYKFYENMIGKELNILFESENNDGTINGFSSNYVKVKNNFSSSLVNEFCKVKIERISQNMCEGKLLGDSNNLKGLIIRLIYWHLSSKIRIKKHEKNPASFSDLCCFTIFSNENFFKNFNVKKRFSKFLKKLQPYLKRF